MTSEAKSGKVNAVSRFFGFLVDARGELRKVIWPNRKTTINYTLVVCGFVVVATLFIWGVDIVFSYLIGLVVK